MADFRGFSGKFARRVEDGRWGAILPAGERHSRTWEGRPMRDDEFEPRLGRMRLSPHVYNDENDVDRFLTVFRRLAPR